MTLKTPNEAPEPKFELPKKQPPAPAPVEPSKVSEFEKNDSLPPGVRHG